MKRLAACAAAMTALLAAGAAAAEDYQARIDLPAGTAIAFTVARSRETTENGRTEGAGLVATSRYRLDVDPAPQGYSVKTTFLDLTLQPSAPADIHAQLAEGMSVLSGVTFTTGEDLSPLEIQNWDVTIDKVVANAAKVGGGAPDDPASASLRRMYESMGRQTASLSLLQDWTLPAAAQNTALDLNKPLTMATEFAFMEGAPPIAGTYAIELAAIDAAAGTARIVTKDSLDPQAAAVAVRAMIELMTRDLPPGVQPPTDAELATMKVDRATQCQYDMDLASGLARRTECASTLTLPGDAGNMTRVDRWVITQEILKD